MKDALIKYPTVESACGMGQLWKDAAMKDVPIML